MRTPFPRSLRRAAAKDAYPGNAGAAAETIMVRSLFRTPNQTATTARAAKLPDRRMPRTAAPGLHG